MTNADLRSANCRAYKAYLDRERRMHGAYYQPPPRWNWTRIVVGALLITALVALLLNERWVLG